MHNCDFCSIMQKICNDNNFPHCTPLWEFIILWVWLAWEGTSDWRIGWTKCLCLTYMCQIIFWNKIKPENSSLLSIRCCLSAGCAKRIGTEMKLHNHQIGRPIDQPKRVFCVSFFIRQSNSFWAEKAFSIVKAFWKFYSGSKAKPDNNWAKIVWCCGAVLHKVGCVTKKTCSLDIYVCVKRFCWEDDTSIRNSFFLH